MKVRKLITVLCVTALMAAAFSLNVAAGESAFVSNTNLRITGEYIRDIPVGAKGSDFLKNFASTPTGVDADGVVKTGMPVIVGDSTFYPIIKGDVNGDGKITTTDYMIIKKVFNKTKTLTGAFKEAADVDENGSIQTVDYIRVKKYFQGYNLYEGMCILPGNMGNDDVKLIKEAVDTTSYNLYTYTFPYWAGDIVFNESVYPMTTKKGENEVIQLLYPAAKIIEVRSSDLKTLYEEGKDYILSEGNLIIPEGSSIKVNDYYNYYLKKPLADHSQNKTGGGYIYFSEGAVFHQAQIAVTYQHNGRWTGPVPAKQGESLPCLQSKIENREELTVVFYGDSISCGANASSTVGASPYTPKWCDMFVEALEEKGLKVTSYNTSVGGQISSYGLANVTSEVIDYSPDLVVLGWGINDASSWNNTSILQYYNNMKAMIRRIRRTLPDCEIILLGSILPNPEAVDFVGPVAEYTEQLKKLAGEYDGVVLANMTEIQTYILTRKNYRDITGNNVNHPNDFTTRMYAQVLLRTISK